MRAWRGAGDVSTALARARRLGARREARDELAALVARGCVFALVRILRRHHVGLHASSLLRSRKRAQRPAARGEAHAARTISLRRLARRSSGGVGAAALLPPRCGEATGRAPARVARGDMAAKRHCRVRTLSSPRAAANPRWRRGDAPHWLREPVGHKTRRAAAAGSSTRVWRRGGARRVRGGRGRAQPAKPSEPCRHASAAARAT